MHSGFNWLFFVLIIRKEHAAMNSNEKHEEIDCAELERLAAFGGSDDSQINPCSDVATTTAIISAISSVLSAISNISAAMTKVPACKPKG